MKIRKERIIITIFSGKINMKIFMDSKAEKLGRNFYNMLEESQKGKGSLFIKKLKKKFDEAGSFRLGYNQVLEVAQTIK